VPEPKPLPGDGYGHGCGHNLLGSASMLAATAVKEYCRKRQIKAACGTYGCPAEEGGVPRASWRAPEHSATWTLRSPAPGIVFRR